jgi:hypothetical protein
LTLKKIAGLGAFKSSILLLYSELRDAFISGVTVVHFTQNKIAGNGGEKIPCYDRGSRQRTLAFR